MNEELALVCPQCGARNDLPGGVAPESSFCSLCGSGLGGVAGEHAPRLEETCARCGDLLIDEKRSWRATGYFCERCAGATTETRDLRFESEFRFVGGLTMIVYTIGACFCVLGAAVLIATGSPPFVVVPLGLLVAGLCALQALLGFYLMKLSNTARVILGILCAVFAAIDVPFHLWAPRRHPSYSSLPVNVALTWLLLCARGARITTPEYRTLVARSPQQPRPFPISAIVALSGLVLGVVVWFS